MRRIKAVDLLSNLPSSSVEVVIWLKLKKKKRLYETTWDATVLWSLSAWRIRERPYKNIPSWVKKILKKNGKSYTVMPKNEMCEEVKV